MSKPLCTLSLLFSIVCFGYGQQNLKTYIGEWIGKTENENPFNFRVTVNNAKNGKGHFKVSNDHIIFDEAFRFRTQINLSLSPKLVFTGELSSDKTKISGFMQLNGDFYPIVLRKDKEGYTGVWDISKIHYLQPQAYELEIRGVDENAEEYPAYPILGTLWCMKFKKQKDSISFTDYKTGLDYKGLLKNSEIIMDIGFGDLTVASITYKKAEENTEQQVILGKKDSLKADGWKVASKPLSFPELEKDVLNNTLEGTEGVIIAEKGQITYEVYFNGFNSEIPHDMRSAAKSWGSTIIGIAIDDGIIENVEQKVYPYLPSKYQYTKDEEKSNIRLVDLLTMRSGINVYESTYQESDNWLKTVLEAPLAHASGTTTRYKSADPFLSGVYLNERLGKPLSFYIQEKLFAPLGITNYIMNADDTGIPYFGGGLYLTPRDMLKLGQLYINKGVWEGNRILSEEWVNASFEKHTRLENVSDKNEYGYFWWHQPYEIDGKTISSVEARGNGGQYIFILPELDTVVVITSGNYRKGQLLRQPEKILSDYILPKLVRG